MAIERELLTSLLKLTKSGAVSHDILKKEARIPSDTLQKFIKKLQTDELVYVRKPFVETNSEQRLKMALRAVTLGADLGKISSLLDWREFEGFAEYALEKNGYNVTRNFRFRNFRQRWEIDIVGCKRPNVICFDCKHWHHILHQSSLKKIVLEQANRCKALSRAVIQPECRLECNLWDNARFIPAVLSLLQGNCRFYDQVPIVSILQLRSFLEELPAHIQSIAYFSSSEHSFQNRLP